MKRKIILTLLCVLTAISFIFTIGCNCNGKGAGNDTPSRDNGKTITIADFEQWAPDFQLIRTVKYFGNLDINKDQAYVKSGKQSLKLQPLGSYTSGSMPTIFFPTVSKTFKFSYTDFTQIDKVTFEFFNSEEREIKVAVGLVTAIDTVDYFDKTSVEFQVLAPNAWTQITYTVNASAINIDANVKNILGIYVSFENVHSREVADAPVIYLDDLIMHRATKPVTIIDLVDLDEKEYIDFEKDWQKYVVGVRSQGDPPELSIVNANEITVNGQPFEATSGEKLLKVVAHQGSVASGSYPGFVLSKSLLQKSLFGSIKLEDLGTTTFAFDIYNNSNYPTLMGIRLYNSTAMKSIELGRTFEANTWTTFSINLKDLYEQYKAKNKNQTELFDDPGAIQIYWPEFIEGGNREFYFDNFRYIVEERDTTAKPTINLAPFVRVAKVGTMIDYPTMKVTDRYDLEIKKTSINVEYNNNGTWEELAPVEGRIPIDKVGDYRLIATATNSLKNTAEEIYYFKGVESVVKNAWATYDFEDEKSNILLHGTQTATNQTSFLETTANEGLNGAVKQGVIKAQMDNADKYGFGYFGLRFASEILKQAREKDWVAFEISIYIASELSTVDILSFQRVVAYDVPTNRWTTLRLTKEDLMTSRTRINEAQPAGTKMTDNAFYEKFGELCGTEPISNFLFFKEDVDNWKDKTGKTITCYFDSVVYLEGSFVFEDGDDVVSDIYPEVNLGDLGIIKKED